MRVKQILARTLESIKKIGCNHAFFQTEIIKFSSLSIKISFTVKDYRSLNNAEKMRSHVQFRFGFLQPFANIWLFGHIAINCAKIPLNLDWKLTLTAKAG